MLAGLSLTLSKNRSTLPVQKELFILTLATLLSYTFINMSTEGQSHCVNTLMRNVFFQDMTLSLYKSGETEVNCAHYAR